MGLALVRGKRMGLALRGWTALVLLLGHASLVKGLLHSPYHSAVHSAERHSALGCGPQHRSTVPPGPLLSLRGGGSVQKAGSEADATMYTLTSVFAVHRFIAGPFGVCLLVFPTALNNAMAMGRHLPAEEKFCLQNWGCFCLAVGYIAHAAKDFELKAQREIAKGMLLCFSCATGLYALTLSSGTLGPSYVRGSMATGAIFLGLLVAYGGGLFLDRAKPGEGVKKKN